MNCVSNFSPHDTWVLLAILYGGGKQGADFRAILAAGDYLNHDILSYADLYGGLLRLQAAGLIEIREGRCYPQQAVLTFFEQPTKRRRSVWAEWDALEQFLATIELQGRFLTPADEPALTQAEYEHALHAYLDKYISAG